MDYGMRVYDPRTGRFLSLDPLTRLYPWYTPYQYAGNSPISNTDLDGAEPKPAIKGTQEGQTTTTSETRSATFGAAGTGHTESYTATETWYWHAGGLQDRNGTTEARWYTKEEYKALLKSTNLTIDLAGYAGKLKLASTTDNWTDGQRANLANTKLGSFLSRGLSPEATDAFIEASLEHADYLHKKEIGNINMSSFNVEDMAGVGILLKQGLKSLGSIAIKRISATETGEIIFSKIAFGVSEHLDDFAKSIGGTTWKTWGTKDFETQFLETINSPVNKLHFNLTGPDGKMFNVWQLVSEGARGLKMSRATSWELYQIYSNPAALGRTTFYFNGNVVPNPFK